ncbi:YozE family protein [Staphylococcus sp. 17KM0847]|uniref:YozE family protein n=1 Tax=Staphylococcus sp. 17KM0847 TaxID=2583989 RepID=UPI0015DCC52F|nr:YozE family protein [Staphylococcus sp. 17KM0847]QLK86830.1 hypothetical protein FGL66_09050 [Staphylococcus sp. 17KM0847]
MSFYEYMQIYIGDDTPLGDLARFIHADSKFPKELHKSDEILAWFREAPRLGHLNLADIKRAIAIYTQFGSAK